MIAVTSAEVEARLMRELTDGESDALAGLAEEASVLIEGYLGFEYSDTDVVPRAVAVTASRVVARVFAAPARGLAANVDQHQSGMGPFSTSTRFVEGSTTGGPWLTRTDKAMLGPYRPGMRSVPLTRGS